MKISWDHESELSGKSEAYLKSEIERRARLLADSQPKAQRAAYERHLVDLMTKELSSPTPLQAILAVLDEERDRIDNAEIQDIAAQAGDLQEFEFSEGRSMSTTEAVRTVMARKRR